MISVDLKKLGKVISDLRTTRDISQEELAKAIGIPRPSISQMEKGARDISFAELNKLLEIFQISYDNFLNLFKGSSIENSAENLHKNNNKIAFNSEKFKQLFLYILQKCGSKPNVGETVLYKLLYFCDFDFFELYEKPLTGMRYKRLQYGPVPDQGTFNPIINEMRKDGVIQKATRAYAGNTIQTKYINFIEADIAIFAPQEIQIINKVVNRLSDMSARQIEDHVHSDYPWKSHKDGEEISYESVFKRTGEFAQRDYDQEFLDIAANDSLENLHPLTQKEYDYYMSLPDKK